MSYAAITYRVKPGREEQVADIFANFKRASSPILRNEQGEKVGMLLGTWLFIKDDIMVRVIQWDGGTLDDIARHMSVQEGAREAERKLAEHLAEPRDTQTPEGFLHYFRNSIMRCISELSLPAEFLLQRQ